MLLRLIITEGPRKGEELVIRGDITLGRSKGDFALKDPKASGRHARIYTNPEGSIVIEDLDSSNGTLVNGVRIKNSSLKVGDTISIGKTTFEVRAETTQESQKASEKGTWQEGVEVHFSQILDSLEHNPVSLPQWGGFRRPVRLEFTQGLQVGSSLTYGFGPREVGKLCPDGLLFDQDAPDIAFTLVPIDLGLCELRTSISNLFINDVRPNPHPNKKSVFAKKLENGDRISFGQTVIVIKAL